MAFEGIDAYIEEVGGRRLAQGEWGLEIDGIEVGLRVSRGLLRAQAWAAPAGARDPAELLHRNRSLELVRYTSTQTGEVWVVGDLVAADDAPVDRLLGALVEAASSLRGAWAGKSGAPGALSTQAVRRRERSRYSR